MSEQRNIYIPPGGPPENRPNPAIYAAMGEANIFLMIEDFYRQLEQSKIRSMFPEDMVEASKRTAAFFVFLLGGPPLYHQKYGPPMMRQRHIPFLIDEAARQEWLNAFKITLEDADVKYNFPKEYIKEFTDFLDRFSGWMVNTKSE